MKRIAFIIMVACMPLMAMSQGVITRPGKKPTKTDTPPPAKQQHSSSSNQRPSRPSAYTVSGTINGHDYVDLGLSVKWATCNVGATCPSDYGSYFAWGETSTKSEYTEANCITYKKNMGDIAGNSQYDAARANWGSTWRLPTKAECEELKNKCNWTWTTQRGHKGYIVTSKTNGNSIFLPAAGYRRGSSLHYAGEDGDYWSSTPGKSSTEIAYDLYFSSSDHLVDWNNHRYLGHSVRPVYDTDKKPAKASTQEQPAKQLPPQQLSSNNREPSRPSHTGSINGHDYVDLGLSVKWATCNVGAASPSDYGSYFAWGETSTKSEYTEENSITHGKNIGDIAGNPQYDAARANWGGTWRLPTKAECEELNNKCTWTWTTQDGHKGCRVTSRTNGSFIFLPAAGFRSGTSLIDAGEYGYYWSSSPYESTSGNAYFLYFYSSYHFKLWGHRGNGPSVRPVSE